MGITHNVIMAAAGGILWLGARSTSTADIFIGLSLTGIGYGGAPALTSATIFSLYGPKNYGTNFDTANFPIIAASVLGPMLSSNLYETSGGTYHSTFFMMIVLSLMALAVSFFINLLSKK